MELQLLQIKLNRGDKSGMNRSEIKFNIDPAGERRRADDLHPMLGLLDRGDRAAARQRFLEFGLEPYNFRPVLTIDQNRRRVYLADQHGAFATVTLDLCSCSDYGTDLRWTEIELELNEIRYTEAGPEQRAWMERVTSDIQEDLLAAFPAIVPDQTSKYTKAFGWIEQTSWWPVRTLIAWDVTPSDVVAASAAVFVLLVFYAAFELTVRRRQRRKGTEQSPSADPRRATGWLSHGG